MNLTDLRFEHAAALFTKKILPNSPEDLDYRLRIKQLENTEVYLKDGRISNNAFLMKDYPGGKLWFHEDKLIITNQWNEQVDEMSIIEFVGPYLVTKIHKGD